MNTEIKIAPHSKDSEMMVIGCMISDREHLKIASESLHDSDFYFTENKILFQSLKNFHKSGRPSDIHLVCEDLKGQGKLNAVGGVNYILSLAQYAGTSVHIEEYVNIIREKSVAREVINLAQETEKLALENADNTSNIIEELAIKIKSLENRHGKKIPIIGISERLKREEEFLEKYRGKKYLGLCVETIKEFNEHFLGLRGLILLAAAPNIGKTALTVQTAVEVLSVEQDACLAYISLEMSKEQIFRRMLLNLSGFNFNSFVFGTQSQQIIDSRGHSAFFTSEELKKIESAKNILKGFGDRLQIIDQSLSPQFDSRTIINFIENLKQTTKTNRAIVVIDYLQVWPHCTQS